MNLRNSLLLCGAAMGSVCAKLRYFAPVHENQRVRYLDSPHCHHTLSALLSDYRTGRILTEPQIDPHEKETEQDRFEYYGLISFNCA